MTRIAVDLGAVLDDGGRCFEAGAFFDAHEAWEQVWRAHGNGPLRHALQGLVQVAAGFHKLHVQGRPVEAARILGRALGHLASGPEAAAVEASTFARDIAKARLAILEDLAARPVAPNAAPVLAALRLALAPSPTPRRA